MTKNMSKSTADERGFIIGRLDQYLGAGNIVATGSRVTTAEVDHSDWDYVVLFEGWRLGRFEKQLEDMGFECETSTGLYDAVPRFKSWRFKDINLIVTRKKKFFKRFAVSTEIARKLNLTSRDDRVYLFNKILYEV